MPNYLAIADSFTNSISSNVNYGSNTELFFASTTYITLIKFDEIIVPDGYRIKSIICNLYFVDSEAMNVIFSITTSEWAEFSVTYNNRPTSIGFTGGSFPVDSSSGWKQFDITEAYNNNYENVANYGFMITSSTGVNHKIKSRENVGNNPYIDVTFELSPPPAPLPLYPFSNIVDKDSIIRFTWQQNFVSSDSELVWNDGTDHTIAIANGNNYYDMPASTLPAGIISWKVRCNAVSSGSFTDFSTPVSFTSATKTATPNILTTGNIATALPLITWDPTAQVKYRIWIKDGTTVVEYRELASTDFQYQTTVLLENSKTYTIELQVADVFGLWSDIDTSSITTVFDTPTLPTFVLTESNGVLNFVITSNANTDYHQLLRLIDGVYTVIRDNIGLNETFDEYEAASGVLESYKIRSFSPVGGYIDTAAQTITINLTDCFISNEAGTLALHARYEPVRQITTLNDATQNNFAGRTKPVAIYGDMVYSTHDYSFEFFNQADVNKLVQMVKNKDKVLIRDNRGRLQWVAIGSIREKDTRHGTAVDLINVFEVER